MTWLARQARVRPGAVAVRVPAAPGDPRTGTDANTGVGGWREVTYRELAARAAAAAARLAQAGIKPGDRVAVRLPGTLDHLVAIHAVAWCGAVLVPLDPRLDHGEVARRLGTVGAAALVDSDAAGGWPDGAGGAEGLPCPVIPADELATATPGATGAPREGSEPVPPPVHRSDDDLHSIVFTSGSTGRAEPVELTWGNHLASATASAFNLGVDRRDDWLCCLPLVHVGGLAIVLRSVLYGTALTLLDGFAPEPVAALLRGGRITLASLVPTMLRRLLALPTRPGAPDHADRAGRGPGLRAILLGGGPSEPELIEAAWRAGLPVLPTYGMTETASQVVTWPLDRLDGLGRPDLRAGSAGAPLFGAEIAIRSAPGQDAGPGDSGGSRERTCDDDTTVATAGATGEIWVRGPMVARSAPVDADGWLRTGDLGRIDDRGDLRVLGRGDQVIVTGGENVAPERVEAALAAHPEVAECAVTGVADPEWGYAVAAAVVPRDPEHPPETAALAAWCRERLAPYEVPKRWHLVTDLPRTAAGKPRRGALAALFDDPPSRS